MDYYDLPKDKTFLISAKGLIFNELGQLLLLRMGGRDHNQDVHYKWDIPGGLIEIYENVSHALIREVEEECGLKAEIGKLLAVNDVLVEGFKFKNGDIKDVRIFVLGFYCTCLDENIKLSEEHEEYKWVDINDFGDWDLIPNAKGLIEKALSNLN